MKILKSYTSLFLLIIMLLCIPSILLAKAEDKMERTYTLDRDGKVYFIAPGVCLHRKGKGIPDRLSTIGIRQFSFASYGSCSQRYYPHYSRSLVLEITVRGPGVVTYSPFLSPWSLTPHNRCHFSSLALPSASRTPAARRGTMISWCPTRLYPCPPRRVGRFTTFARGR